MPTAGDVARSALAAVASSANVELATQWVSERYAQLAARLRLRHLRRAGAVTIPAVISAGTATVARGASVVTGDGVSDVAWFIPGTVGRYFQARTAWYKIVGIHVVSGVSASLVLETPFAENDVTAGSYRIVQRYARLPTGARFTKGWTFQRLWTPLTQISAEELDRLVPGRRYLSSLSGGGYVADAGMDDESERIVEVWPYSTTTESLAFLYWVAPTPFSVDSELPPVVDAYVLKDGVLIDVMRHRAATTTKVEEMGFWRNESRAQETTWDRRLVEASRSDRGADDIHFLLHSFGRPGPRDIVTARDEVWSR